MVCQKIFKAKVPASVLKRADSSPYKQSPPAQSQRKADKAPAKSAAPPKTVPTPSKKKSQAPLPAKDSNVDSTAKKTTSPKQSTPTTSSSLKDKAAPMAQILECLSKSDKFYFPADKTPRFDQLYPGTSMPRFSRLSGNVRIAPEAFKPLLAIRIKSAYAHLSQAKLRTDSLPKKFLSYQTRLICRSVQQTLDHKKEAKKTKKAKITSKQSKSKVEFVPAALSFPSDSSSVVPVPEEDGHDKILNFRDLRENLQAVLAELDAGVKPDPRLIPKVLKSSHLPPLFKDPTPQYSTGCQVTHVCAPPTFKVETIPDPVTKALVHSITRTITFNTCAAHPSEPHRFNPTVSTSTSSLSISKILAVVQRRTSLAYESSLSSSIWFFLI